MNIKKLIVLSVFIVVSNTYANEKKVTITAPIILLADNQEHERNGTLTYIGGYFIHKMSGSAMRNPRQDVYTKYAMKYILDQNPTSKVVHLGDFLDISCKSESDRFFSLMDQYIYEDRLAFGLGNHDGFYVGNYAYEKDSNIKISFQGPDSWRDRCNNGYLSKELKYNTFDVIQDKTKVINGFMKYGRIINTNNKRNGVCAKGMECNEIQVSDFWKIYTQNTIINNNVKSKKVSYFGKEGVGQFWRAYVVSEIDFPQYNDSSKLKVKMLILDTSQSEKHKNNAFNTSFSKLGFKPDILYGNVLEEQRKLVELKLEQDCGEKKCLFILAGHHPVKDLKKSAKEWIEKLYQNNQNLIPTYFSAHTHEGYTQDYKSFKEVNIGALIENNPSFHMIQVIKDNNEKYDIEYNKYSISTYLKPLNCPVFEKDDIDLISKGDFSKSSLNEKIDYVKKNLDFAIYQLENIKKEAESDNKIAKEIWNGVSQQYSLVSIYDQMNRIIEDDKMSYLGERCKPKSEKGLQNSYWEAGTYKNGESLLNNLKKIKRSFFDTENVNKFCDGKNNHKDGPNGKYLAHADALFLGQLQDWFEKIPTEAFSKNYHVCQYKHTIDIEKEKY